MSHLVPEQLYAAVFDGSPLSSEAAQHLAQCAACRREHDGLAALAGDLAASRAAAAAPAALDRYASLYSHVQQSPSPLQGLWRTFTALLAWDSRQQPALQGVRSAGASAYRLLYASQGGEIELMVESDGHLFRVQGEIMAQDETGLGAGAPGDDRVDEGSGGERQPGPALVQWFAPGGELLYETQSSGAGQFALRGVQPGRYRLAIVPAAGDAIEIEALEIA